MAQLAVINARIEKLGNAERVTKAELAALSRELLEYVCIDGGKGEPSHDIDAVNRTIAVLTPMNKRTASIFFPEFLPWSFDEKTGRFGKMNKKAFDKKAEAIKAWLADDTNDIWRWALDNIRMDKKPPEYAKQIQKLIERALDDDEHGIGIHEVLVSVVSAGISVADIIVEMEKARIQMDEQGAEPEPAAE